MNKKQKTKKISKREKIKFKVSHNQYLTKFFGLISLFLLDLSLRISRCIIWPFSSVKRCSLRMYLVPRLLLNELTNSSHSRHPNSGVVLLLIVLTPWQRTIDVKMNYRSEEGWVMYRLKRSSKTNKTRLVQE